MSTSMPSHVWEQPPTASELAELLMSAADTLDPGRRDVDDLTAAELTARTAASSVRRRRGEVRALRFAARYLHGVRHAPDAEVAAVARGLAAALVRDGEE